MLIGSEVESLLSLYIQGMSTCRTLPNDISWPEIIDSSSMNLERTLVSVSSYSYQVLTIVVWNVVRPCCRSDRTVGHVAYGSWMTLRYQRWGIGILNSWIVSHYGNVFADLQSGEANGAHRARSEPSLSRPRPSTPRLGDRSVLWVVESEILVLKMEMAYPILFVFVLENVVEAHIVHPNFARRRVPMRTK